MSERTYFRPGDIRIIVIFGAALELFILFVALLISPVNPYIIAFMCAACYILGVTASLGARLNNRDPEGD